MKAEFIINPMSGKQNYLKSIESVVGCLVLNQVVNGIDVVYTQHEGDAEEAARRIKKDEYDFVVAVGGDGTLNDVINGLIQGGSGTPLAVISMGTANEFAQYIKTPQTPEDFCKMIMEFKTIEMDAGIVNGKYFINRVSGGMGSNIADRVSQESKAVLGKFAYYVEGALDLSRKGIQTFRLQFDSPQFCGTEEVLSFMVMNACSQSGFYWGFPEAEPDDGLLDVLICKKMDLGQVPSLGIQTLAKKITKHPKIHHFRTDRIRIDAGVDSECIVDYDGKFYGHLPVEISILPKAIKIIIP